MPPFYLFFMLVMLVMLSNVCVWLAQQVRKLMRVVVNSIFTEPVGKGSSPELQAIVQLITGQPVSPAVAADFEMACLIETNLSFAQVAPNVRDQHSTV